MNSKDFAARMSQHGNDVVTKANEIKKQTMRVIVEEIVPATPVATGKARSNYVIGLGSPNRAIVEASGIDRQGETAKANALALIDQSKPGEPLYLSNNLPYIQVLNDGSSRQAPAGFVEQAVKEGENYIKTTVSQKNEM